MGELGWGSLDKRRGVPKLILPGQSQPMLRHELYPSMQAKANAIVDPIKEKEVRSLCGFSIPTEESLTPDSQKKPAIQAPEEDTLRKSLLHLIRGLSPWHKDWLWLSGLDTAHPALPSLDNGAAGPEEGPASMLLKKDAGCQLSVPTQGRAHAQAEDRSWCCDTAPNRNTRLELNRKVHSKLWIHTARKCLEIKLEILPMAVQRSMDMLQGPVPGLSGLRQAGTGHLWPRKGSAPVAKAKQLRQKEWVPQQQVQASLTCTMVPMTPCSCLDSISSNSPVLGQERSPASLEAWTLHSTSCSSGNEMDTDPKDAQKTPCGIVKDSIGPASTLVSPSLFSAFPPMDTKPEKSQGAHMCSIHEGFMEQARGAPQRHCACCKIQGRPADGSFPRGIAPLESTMNSSSKAAFL